jgi:hypothetical protein
VTAYSLMTAASPEAAKQDLSIEVLVCDWRIASTRSYVWKRSLEAEDKDCTANILAPTVERPMPPPSQRYEINHRDFTDFTSKFIVFNWVILRVSSNLSSSFLLHVIGKALGGTCNSVTLSSRLSVSLLCNWS